MARQRSVGIRDFTTVFVKELERGIVVIGGEHRDPRCAHHCGVVGVIGVEEWGQCSWAYG